MLSQHNIFLKYWTKADSHTHTHNTQDMVKRQEAMKRPLASLFLICCQLQEEAQEEQTVPDILPLWNKHVTNEHSHLQPAYMTLIPSGDKVHWQTDTERERESYRTFWQPAVKCWGPGKRKQLLKTYIHRKAYIVGQQKKEGREAEKWHRDAGLNALEKYSNDD